ncbi:Protein tyrosine phosphatase type IVA 1 [Geranomyces michiganensis]|nr:Protein tyrosine phosphatase type IVA 1 [Geranomyces michiganensis]
MATAKTLQVQSAGIRPQRQGSAAKDGVVQRMPNPPAFVEYKNLRFLIFDAPSDRTLDLYLQELAKHNVTDVVRVCDPTYDKATLIKKGIAVHDWPFPDGDPPPQNVVSEFLALVNSRFGKTSKPAKASAVGVNGGAGGGVGDGASLSAENVSSTAAESKTTIGVHCVAGLGRAPVLVTMALIEAGLAPLDAVIYVRERRRGAINARQLKYVESYKRRTRGDKGCIIC